MPMHRPSIMLAALLCAAAMACDDPLTAPRSATDTVGLVDAPGHDLELTLPALGRAEALDPPRLPRAAAPPDVPEDYDLPASIIYSARSYPYAFAGAAGNEAVTVFSGNQLRVDVWATVTFLAEPIVTNFKQTTQKAYVFPKTKKTHSAFSNIRIEGGCGHTASGYAQHAAWVDYGPFDWGVAEAPSAGTPYSQPPCETSVVPNDGDAPGGGSGPPPGEIYTCWYRYYYDIDTGEVLHTELLYCESI